MYYFTLDDEKIEIYRFFQVYSVNRKARCFYGGMYEFSWHPYIDGHPNNKWNHVSRKWTEYNLPYVLYFDADNDFKEVRSMIRDCQGQISSLFGRVKHKEMTCPQIGSCFVKRDDYLSLSFGRVDGGIPEYWTIPSVEIRLSDVAGRVFHVSTSCCGHEDFFQDVIDFEEETLYYISSYAYSKAYRLYGYMFYEISSFLENLNYCAGWYDR